jgi:hypothetical protein
MPELCLAAKSRHKACSPPPLPKKRFAGCRLQLARESKKKSDNDCGAIFDPIEQNNINKTKNDSFPETDNRLPILSTMLQRCTYPNKYHVKNFKHS